MVNWKDQASKDRLLAAVIADVTSKGAKLNCSDIARLYGQGATYDAVEGQLRSHKKLAKELIDSAPAEIAGPTKARGSKKELDKDAVRSGRIVKTSRKSAIAATKSVKTLLESETDTESEHNDVGHRDGTPSA